ncbi:MarR family transcriptional regulator [Sutcliffiella cohnii]|uniref:MarR family winged helix-turn-helix transcriptional regulator n=1 Tax=Sutcliffiella cohnii TaxID=33932 RepID=UPI002E20639F|nr:MarR family transcriptional regulator [Sutcliffiella cohnii]
MERNIEKKFGYQVGMVAHLYHNLSNERLAHFDITVAQARVLYILVQHGPQTQVELQQQLYVKASTMTGIIDSLLSKSLIEKTDSEQDKRAKIITVTDKGKELDQKIWEDMSDMEEKILAGFSKEELALFKFWLSKVKDNICKLNEGGE